MSEELTRVLYSNNAGIKIENKGNDKDPKGIREKLLQPTKTHIVEDQGQRGRDMGCGQQ